VSLSQNISISNRIQSSFFKKFKFFFRSLFYIKEIEKLDDLLTYQSLQSIKSKHIDIYNKPFRKYLLCSNNTKQKFNFLYEHYNFIKNKFNTKAINEIYTTQMGYNLIQIETKNLGIFNISLCYIPSLGKEGELTLLLHQNNQDIYSLQLSFYKDQLLIGGIQSRINVSNDLLKKLTKELYGIRPRNLLFFVTRQICEHMNIKTLKAVQTKEHIANCSHVSKTDKFQANYDQYWEEENGKKIDFWYILSEKEQRKDIENIASKKRSQYKKRYAMLDEYKNTIKQNLIDIV
jgi:uncharacterized protein VirK/YbjX